MVDCGRGEGEGKVGVGAVYLGEGGGREEGAACYYTAEHRGSKVKTVWPV